MDYWLRDGDQLRRYQWEPWEENLLWTLDDVPGSLISIDWNENSQDLNGDGKPDLKIIWDLDTQEQEMIFTTDDQGFRLVDFNGN